MCGGRPGLLAWAWAVECASYPGCVEKKGPADCVSLSRSRATCPPPLQSCVPLLHMRPALTHWHIFHLRSGLFSQPRNHTQGTGWPLPASSFGQLCAFLIDTFDIGKPFWQRPKWKWQAIAQELQPSATAALPTVGAAGAPSKAQPAASSKPHDDGYEQPASSRAGRRGWARRAEAAAPAAATAATTSCSGFLQACRSVLPWLGRAVAGMPRAAGRAEVRPTRPLHGGRTGAVCSRCSGSAARIRSIQRVRTSPLGSPRFVRAL